MDSDEEIMYDDYDSGNESSGDDDVEFAMVEEPNNPKERQELDEYPYEVLTTEQILQHMNDCIKEVNIVVEVCAIFLFMLCNIINIFLLSDALNCDQNVAEPFPLGQREADGKVLRWRSRKTFYRGTCCKSICQSCCSSQSRQEGPA